MHTRGQVAGDARKTQGERVKRNTTVVYKSLTDVLPVRVYWQLCKAQPLQPQVASGMLSTMWKSSKALVITA